MTRHDRRISKLEATNGGRRRIEELKLDYLAHRAQTGDEQAVDDLIDMLQARCARYLDEAPAIRSRILAEIEGAPPELIDAYEAAHARQVRAMRMLTGQEPPDKDFITRTPAVFESVLARVKNFLENREIFDIARAIWPELKQAVADCPRCAARMPEDSFESWWAKTQQPKTKVT